MPRQPDKATGNSALGWWELDVYSAPMLGAQKTPQRMLRRFRINSLTMSYFHTGIRTIIGAEAFHCPVRDGKEWYHLAMVVRHNFLSSWAGQITKDFNPVKTTNL